MADLTPAEMEANERGFRTGMAAAAALVLLAHNNRSLALEILAAADVDAYDLATLGLADDDRAVLMAALATVKPSPFPDTASDP